jgi:hypothetical protein
MSTYINRLSFAIWLLLSCYHCLVTSFGVCCWLVMLEQKENNSTGTSTGIVSVLKMVLGSNPD